ncbi:hypothetical protein [Wenxinia marina]|uniref:FG-GAP repeat protein n=1 Tax=Wenxinia marina DSM 24838 TaxID=1123501 RepID=A0A0D0QE07_9RHOB|nr:hypothetical protein [Wenxinia marina]KIQ70597.1 hypothetical protein Wenmar_00975 [Wenxinia marina DSM 24838]GGL51823.1 hypothetical protein GCM10011392_02740 [Wenxinia marina]
MKGSAAILALCLAGPAAAQTVEEWPVIEQALGLGDIDLAEIGFSTRTVRADIDGDGAEDLMVVIDSSATCSNGIVVCAAAVLDGRSLRVLWTGSAQTLYAAPGADGGWDLVVRYHTLGNDGQPYLIEDYHDWNGSGFTLLDSAEFPVE